MGFRGSSKYPFTSPEDWRTRGWTLIRKIARAGTTPPTDNDRRVAMLLLGHAHASRAYHAQLRGLLEGVAYGGESPKDNA